MITEAQLQQFSPRAMRFVEGLQDAVSIANLSTSARVVMFLAQCAHESGGFGAVAENLNYSEQALCSLFPSHFNSDSARRYARQPQRIANRLYASRMGNGDETSGDGWRFRGRGLIQITGQKNYASCSIALYHDERLLVSPELLEQPLDAARSAAWYWDTHSLNRFVDSADFFGLTKAINGGTNGLEDRKTWLARAQGIWR